MSYTYSKIANVTVSAGGVSSINFLTIPQNYTDLLIKLSLRGDRASTYDFIKLKFNGSATGYTQRTLFGDGGAAQSDNGNSTTYAWLYIIDAANDTVNTFGNADIYIPNYTSSNNKSISSDAITENNASQAYTAMNANVWSNSAAITSMTIESATGNNFVQYSTATLYGIKAEV